ncbi:MAG: response regulator [Lysobacterales bacterium]
MARAALVAVDRHDPDLVLLDIRMPGIDGLEVARRLSLRSSPQRWSSAPPTTNTPS